MQQSISNSAKRLGKTSVIVEPELRWGLELYYDAFWELDKDRSHGSGYTYIPWSSVVRYIQLYELDEDQAERFQAHISAMDNAYITHLVEKHESERKGK
jgi:hypothetical protein